MSWETVIGLEVHVQANTRSKAFCGCATDFGAEPNSQTCPVCLGMPGQLPMLNKEAVDKTVLTGLAIDATINLESRFDRKNYFYPDLPKGYQISQFAIPVVERGYLDIPVGEGEKRIGITRIHMEEDAGKSLHEGLDGVSHIDLNRSGVPLMEIVSEPDMRSADEAVAYLKQLHQLVRFLGVSDADMEKGQFRCDANVSVRRTGEPLGTRAELKNLNSFRFIKQAIEYEVARQIELIEDGGEVVQETRLFDSAKGESRPMRSKEEAHDYRYFPDPDLPPLRLSASEVEAIRTLAKLRGDGPVHVAHVTCVEALDTVPQGVTTEATPHHLFLDYTRPLKAFGKVNPPLRGPADRQALWDAFAAGRIDIAATDHAPHTREEKEEPFDEAPSGLPGVATSLPLLLRQVRAEALSLERFVEATAARPAEILGVPKGRIEVGRDADLIVVDAREVVRITPRRVRYKCGWTPFEGMEGVFPRTVYLRGERIVEDGEPIAEGLGQPLAPRPPD